MVLNWKSQPDCLFAAIIAVTLQIFLITIIPRMNWSNENEIISWKISFAENCLISCTIFVVIKSFINFSKCETIIIDAKFHKIKRAQMQFSCNFRWKLISYWFSIDLNQDSPHDIHFQRLRKMLCGEKYLECVRQRNRNDITCNNHEAFN